MNLVTDVNYILKPAVNGAVTAAAMYKMGGGKIFLFGQYVPSWYVTGAVGAASSVVAEMAHAWILPHLSPNEKFAQVESSILAPVIAGVAQVAALEFISPGASTSIGLTKVFATGAGAEIVGQYVWEKSIVPLEQSY